MDRIMRKSKAKSVVDSYCRICLQESKHYLEIVEHEGEKLSPVHHELIKCRRCSSHFHSACLGQHNPSITKIEKVEDISILTQEFECRFCDEKGKIMDSGNCCLCLQSGYLNATVFPRESTSSGLACHLSCALFHPEIRIKSIASLTFEEGEIKTDHHSEQHSCIYCGQKCTQRCAADGCSKYAHLRCIQSKNKEILMTNRKQVKTFVEATGYSHYAFDGLWVINYGKEDLLKNEISCYCEDHKGYTSTYCNCGINREKLYSTIDVEEDLRNGVESVQCDSCMLWIHSDCAANKGPIHYPTEENEKYYCEKCAFMEKLVLEPIDTVGNLRSNIKRIVSEITSKTKRINYTINLCGFNRYGVTFQQLMIVLRGLENVKNLLLSHELKFIQMMVPVELSFLKETNPEHDKSFDIEAWTEKFAELLYSKSIHGLDDPVVQDIIYDLEERLKLLPANILDQNNLRLHSPKKIYQSLRKIYSGDSQMYDYIELYKALKGLIFDKAKKSEIIKDSNLEYHLAKFFQTVSVYQKKIKNALKDYLAFFSEHSISDFDDKEFPINFDKVLSDLLPSSTIARYFKELKANYISARENKIPSVGKLDDLKEQTKSLLIKAFFGDIKASEQIRRNMHICRNAHQWMKKWHSMKRKRDNLKDKEYNENKIWVDPRTTLFLFEEMEELRNTAVEQNLEKIVSFKELKSLISKNKKKIGKGRANNNVAISTIKKRLAAGIALSISEAYRFTNHEIQEKTSKFLKRTIALSETDLLLLCRGNLPEEITTVPQEIINLVDLLKRLPSEFSTLLQQDNFDKIKEFDDLLKYRIEGDVVQKLRQYNEMYEYVERLRNECQENGIAKNSTIGQFAKDFREQYFDQISSEWDPLFDFVCKPGQKKFDYDWPGILRDIFECINQWYIRIKISKADVKKKVQYIKLLEYNRMARLVNLPNLVRESRKGEDVLHFINDVNTFLASNHTAKSFAEGITRIGSNASSIYKIPSGLILTRYRNWLENAKIICWLLLDVGKFNSSGFTSFEHQRRLNKFFLILSQGFIEFPDCDTVTTFMQNYTEVIARSDLEREINSSNEHLGRRSDEENWLGDEIDIPIVSKRIKTHEVDDME